MLLGRGQERASGGRRAVVAHALEELVAAHAIAPGLDEVLQELIEDDRRQAAQERRRQLAQVCCRRSAIVPTGGVTVSAADGPTGGGGGISGGGGGGGGSGVHPALVYAATGRLSLSTLLFTSRLSAAHWKALVGRDRVEEAAFTRRLQTWSAINIVRTRALLKATGRVTHALLYCRNYLAGTGAWGMGQGGGKHE